MRYGIYPNSTPEFRMVHKANGTMIMQVRYTNASTGYVGKWLDVKTEKADDTTSHIKTSNNL